MEQSKAERDSMDRYSNALLKENIKLKEQVKQLLSEQEATQWIEQTALEILASNSDNQRFKWSEIKRAINKALQPLLKPPREQTFEDKKMNEMEGVALQDLHDNR